MDGKNAPNVLSPGQKNLLVTPGHRANHPGEKLLLATNPETAYIRFSDMDTSVFFAFVATKRTNSESVIWLPWSCVWGWSTQGTSDVLILCKSRSDALRYAPGLDFRHFLGHWYPDAKNTRCYELILCGHIWTGFLFVGQFVLRQIDRECYVGNITDVNR